MAPSVTESGGFIGSRGEHDALVDDVVHRNWFDPEKFTGNAEGDASSTDAYVDELRLYVPTDELKAELNALLAKLKQELVDLINRDYDDFVNLSTNLVDVDSAADRIREPLSDLHANLSAKKALVDAEIAALADGLRRRNDVERAKAALELVQDTTNVVSKVEKLLSELIDAGDDGRDGDKGAQHLDARSQQLERISSEYSRLKYYLSKGQGLTFLSGLEGKLKAVDSTFFSLLDGCASKAFALKHKNAIHRCIQAYNSVGAAKSAERVFQHSVVRPIVSRLLLSSAASSSTATGVASTVPIDRTYDEILDGIEKEAGHTIKSIMAQIEGNKGCNIAAAILGEVDAAIAASLPNLFSPGIPDTFRSNYAASIGFVRNLVKYCPNPNARKAYQESHAMAEFLKRWNLTVYYSLRFQDIAGSFEKCLNSDDLHRGGDSESPFFLGATDQLYSSLGRTFSETVFLPSLANKFCRLGFQLVSRYNVWLTLGVSSKKAKEDTSAWSKLGKEDLIRIMGDVSLLSHRFDAELRDTISNALVQVGADLCERTMPAFNDAISKVCDVNASIQGILAVDVVQECVDLLKHVRGITATYRMTNRPLPSRPSHYVSSILKPASELKKTLSDANVPLDVQNAMCGNVVEQVTKKYDETAEELLRTVRQTESSLKRLKQRQVQATGGSSGSEDSHSDADKICMQLFLDVREYGKQLEKLSLPVRSALMPEYQHLWSTVAPPDKREIDLS